MWVAWVIVLVAIALGSAALSTVTLWVNDRLTWDTALVAVLVFWLGFTILFLGIYALARHLGLGG